MDTIYTIDGKVIKVVSACIRVSRHGDRVFNRFELTAVLPGGRKPHLLSESPYFGRIVLRPLFGYAKGAEVAPAEYALAINDAPVVSDPLFPIEITQEIKAAAYADCRTICACPAVAG